MQITTYTPNWDDKRVLRKAKSVLEWAVSFKNGIRAFELPKTQITKIFGNTSNEGMAKYLRAQLLVDEGTGYLVGVYSKKYRINKEGFDKILAEVSARGVIDPNIEVQYFKEKYKEELAGTKDFEYTDKSYRLWHRLQFLSRKTKELIFSAEEGWFDYDISAAMPTFFIQMHEIYTRKRFQNEEVIQGIKSLPAIQHYIENKSAVRKELQARLDIDEKTVKKIINGLFLGARLTPHHKCAIFCHLDQFEPKLALLKMDPWVQQLQKDIKKFWAQTGKWFNLERIKSGLAPINKNKLYFYFERQALEAIRSEVEKSGFVHIYEHDGFRVKGQIDIKEIEKKIKQQTGVAVKLDN